MASAQQQCPGVLASTLSSSHEAVAEKAALQRRIDELEAKAHADAARLAELGSLLENSDLLARRLRLQYEVAGILAKSISIEEALPLILRAVGEIKQWDIAIAWVLEDGAWVQRYDWCSQDVDASSFLAESREWRFELDQALPGRAIQENRLIWVDDFSSEPGLPRAQTEAGEKFGAALAFPVHCRDSVYCIIEFIRRSPGILGAGTQELFDVLRNDIGRFIEVRLYEARLKQEHAMLEEAQRIAKLAHWRWIPDSEQLRIDVASDEVLGLNRLELPATLGEYLAMVPPEDHGKLHAAFESAKNQSVNTLEIEHGLYHADGTRHIVTVRAETFFDETGKLCEAFGTIQDITERRLVESRSRATERRWEAIFKNSPLPTFITDTETASCLAANGEMLEWLGMAEEDVLGRTSVELGIWSSTYLREKIVSRVLELGYLRNFEVLTHRQEAPRSILISVECVELQERSCFLVQFIDITDRKRLEATLRLTAAAVDQAAEAMVILDDAGSIMTVNPAFTRITGYHSAAAVGQSMAALLYRPTGRYGERFFRRVTGNLTLAGRWEGEIWAQRKDGGMLPTLLSLSAIRDDSDNVVNYVGVFNDISEQKSNEQKLRKLALHDSLTGLPNRSLLMEHLGQAVAHAQRVAGTVGVFFADLDRFKSVNDLFGHDVGDELLKQVATRFRECVRASDTVARLGGDEFVVVLCNDPSSRDAERVAEKIIAVMAQPFTVGESKLQVGVSVGIALYPEHARDANGLLKRADKALYRVKQSGRNGYGFYTPAAPRTTFDSSDWRADI